MRDKGSIHISHVKGLPTLILTENAMYPNFVLYREQNRGCLPRPRRHVTFFYQRVSIYSKLCKRWYSQRRNVRPSVCPSHSGIVSKRRKGSPRAKGVTPSVTIFSPSESLNILVSRNIWSITKFERGRPERWRFMRLGCIKLAILTIFRPINYRISETVQDRTKVAIDH